MNKEENTRLEHIEESQKNILNVVTELKMSIVGSEKIGFKGLVKTVSQHDEYIEGDKRKKWMLAGAVTVIASALGLFWSKLIGG